MSYTIELAEAVRPGDEVVQEKGVTVLVDPKAVLFLLGTEMDFQTTKLASQFVFNNPNQTSACGCGESVALTPGERGPAGLGRRLSAAARMRPAELEDLFAPIGHVSVRRMFGGHGVYADGVIFALETGGVVYLKTDAETRARISKRQGPTPSAMGRSRKR